MSDQCEREGCDQGWCADASCEFGLFTMFQTLVRYAVILQPTINWYLKNVSLVNFLLWYRRRHKLVVARPMWRPLILLIIVMSTANRTAFVSISISYWPSRIHLFHLPLTTVLTDQRRLVISGPLLVICQRTWPKDSSYAVRVQISFPPWEDSNIHRVKWHFLCDFGQHLYVSCWSFFTFIACQPTTKDLEKDVIIIGSRRTYRLSHVLITSIRRLMSFSDKKEGHKTYSYLW